MQCIKYLSQRCKMQSYYSSSSQCNLNTLGKKVRKSLLSSDTEEFGLFSPVDKSFIYLDLVSIWIY